ncbi:hypothetical protein ACIRQQ_45540 [Streptomyces fuscichromogenes]|uniref:hypothetical protein n=1 Tax=Streptomyces fuscichromogenes TaxID=1324013 RepID=UPI0037FE310B
MVRKWPGSWSRTCEPDYPSASESDEIFGFLGKAFWSGHPFHAGQIDDFRVHDTALNRAGVRSLVGDAIPTFTGALSGSRRRSGTCGC